MPWRPADADTPAPAHYAVLEELLAIRRRYQALAEELDATARRAKDTGASWSEVGAALGVSGSAAYQKYGKEPDSRTIPPARGLSSGMAPRIRTKELRFQARQLRGGTTPAGETADESEPTPPARADVWVVPPRERKQQ